MEDIVYEVFGGALILGIILVVIVLFRNSTNVIQEATISQNDLDSTSIEDTIGYDGGVYNSHKVREAIKYSDVNADFYNVYLRNSDSANYEKPENDNEVSENASYNLKVRYYAKKVDNSQEVENGTSDNKPLVKGNPDIKYIYFLYTKK